MKRIIAAALVMSLILCGCRVGPREGVDAIPTQDFTETLPAVTDTEYSEQVTPPMTETSAIGTEEPDVTTVPDIIEPEPETSQTTEREPVSTTLSDFTVDYFDEIQVLYSTISLNVRSGPSVDYESIGALYEGQAANALGYVRSTGWYLIEYSGSYGFVSGYYMTEENPNPPEEEFPQPDPLDHAMRSTIIGDYAVWIGVDYDSVVLAKYYGNYDAGQVVFLFSTALAYTADMKYFTVAGYDFELGSGGYSINLHTSDGEFIDIAEAYETGLLSAEDIAAVHYYGENY